MHGCPCDVYITFPIAFLRLFLRSWPPMVILVGGTGAKQGCRLKVRSFSGQAQAGWSVNLFWKGLFKSNVFNVLFSASTCGVQCTGNQCVGHSFRCHSHLKVIGFRYSKSWRATLKMISVRADNGYPVLVDTPPLAWEQAAKAECLWVDSQLSVTDRPETATRGRTEGRRRDDIDHRSIRRVAGVSPCTSGLAARVILSFHRASTRVRHFGWLDIFETTWISPLVMYLSTQLFLSVSACVRWVFSGNTGIKNKWIIQRASPVLCWLTTVCGRRLRFCPRLVFVNSCKLGECCYTRNFERD